MKTTNHILIFSAGTYTREYADSHKGNTYNLNQLETRFGKDVRSMSLADFLSAMNDDNNSIDYRNWIVDINYIGDTQYAYDAENPRFSFQELDEDTNIPDLQKWVDERKLVGVVDEEKGGIIGYINHEHEDMLYQVLNNC